MKDTFPLRRTIDFGLPLLPSLDTRPPREMEEFVFFSEGRGHGPFSRFSIPIPLPLREIKVYLFFPLAQRVPSFPMFAPKKTPPLIGGLLFCPCSRELFLSGELACLFSARTPRRCSRFFEPTAVTLDLCPMQIFLPRRK